MTGEIGQSQFLADFWPALNPTDFDPECPTAQCPGWLFNWECVFDIEELERWRRAIERARGRPVGAYLPDELESACICMAFVFFEEAASVLLEERRMTRPGDVSGRVGQWFACKDLLDPLPALAVPQVTAMLATILDPVGGYSMRAFRAANRRLHGNPDWPNPLPDGIARPPRLVR